MASVITFAFSPAVLSAITFATLLYPHIISSLFVICLSFATFLPLMMIYGLSKLGLISDFFVSEREQRTTPLLGAIVSYLVGGLVLWALKAPGVVTALMFCYVGNTLVMLLITRRWKVSVHASGLAGPATVLILTLGMWAGIFFALLLPVGWARVRLRAHTPTQVVVGALVTVIATWIQFRVYLLIL